MSSSGSQLELEQSWALLHEVMNQLTPARLHAQRLLARLQNGDDPNSTEWREALLRIDLATLNALGLLKDCPR